MSNVKDNIWITSRARMIVERKSLRNQTASYLTVTYYSIFTILISIFSEFYSKTYSKLDEINLAASVVVLVASLVAGGFRFEAKANVFRECYLKLQKLLKDNCTEEQRASRYDDILWDYPNHTTADYYDLIIQHTYWEGKKLTNGSEEIKRTKYIWFSYIFRRATYYGIISFLFLVPVAFLAAPFFDLCATP